VFPDRRHRSSIRADQQPRDPRPDERVRAAAEHVPQEPRPCALQPHAVAKRVRVERLLVRRQEREAKRPGRLVGAVAAGGDAERAAPGRRGQRLRAPVRQRGGFVGCRGAAEDVGGAGDAGVDGLGEACVGVAEERADDGCGAWESGGVDFIARCGR